MNTNMKLIALILILLTPTWAIAQKYDPNIKLSDIAPFKIVIIDSSKSGCWTNITEVIDYAAAQINLAGSEVVETDQEAKGYFLINVNSARLSSGPCYGHVQTSFFQYNSEGFLSVNSFSDTGLALMDVTNINNRLFDIIKEAIEEWKD